MKRRIFPVESIAGALALFAFAACSSSSAPSTTTCIAGAERCECYPNGSCNHGLVCASNVCVYLGGSGGGAGESGADPDRDAGEAGIGKPNTGVEGGVDASLDGLGGSLIDGRQNEEIDGADETTGGDASGVCSTNDECTRRATLANPEAGGAVVESVCLKPEGKCAQLKSPECQVLTGDYTNNDAILIGSLFATSPTGANGATNSTATANLQRQQGAILAINEINMKGGIPAPGNGGSGRPERWSDIVLPAGTGGGRVFEEESWVRRSPIDGRRRRS